MEVLKESNALFNFIRFDIGWIYRYSSYLINIINSLLRLELLGYWSIYRLNRFNNFSKFDRYNHT